MPQPRDEWGDLDDNVGRAHAGGVEVRDEEWGDFDEGVNDNLDFPSGNIALRPFCNSLCLLFGPLLQLRLGGVIASLRHFDKLIVCVLFEKSTCM